MAAGVSLNQWTLTFNEKPHFPPQLPFKQLSGADCGWSERTSRRITKSLVGLACNFKKC
jgi:hypothetical protein